MHVLFLCTGNSCRSQMAEAILRALYGNRFEVSSCGSSPDLGKFRETGGVHPLALRTLTRNGIPTTGLHAKLWDDFISGRTPVDIVLTLCGSARGELAEACPVFPGKAISAHWGIDDPSHAAGNPEEIDLAFQQTFEILREQIAALAELIFDSVPPVSREDLQKQIREIGEREGSHAE